jgi:hypothetical protein
VKCHISFKSSQQGLQLCFIPHLNQRFAQKVIGLQSHGSPNLGNFETPNLGVSRQNDIWVQATWPSTKNIIRGKVVGSLNSGHGEFCKSVFAHGLSVHQKCSNYALTNLLFGLCMSMWIIDLLVARPSPHLEAPTCPSTPEVLRTRERTRTPYPFVVFTFRFTIESIRELGGASRRILLKKNIGLLRQDWFLYF